MLCLYVFYGKTSNWADSSMIKLDVPVGCDGFSITSSKTLETFSNLNKLVYQKIIINKCDNFAQLYPVLWGVDPMTVKMFLWPEGNNLRQGFTATGHLPRKGDVICVREWMWWFFWAKSIKEGTVRMYVCLDQLPLQIVYSTILISLHGSYI